MFLPGRTATSRSYVTTAWLFLLLNLLISDFLIEQSCASSLHHLHHLHVPIRYRRKIKYGVKLAAAVGIAATKKVWLPVPVPFPIPIPIFKTYQPILIKKKAWLFGGFGHGLGFGGLHGGLGMGGYGWG